MNNDDTPTCSVCKKPIIVGLGEAFHFAGRSGQAVHDTCARRHLHKQDAATAELIEHIGKVAADRLGVRKRT